MMGILVALALQLTAPPPKKTPPAPAQAHTKSLRSRTAKKKDRPRATAFDRKMILRNREFLQMLEMLIALPMLADDDELEQETKK